MSGNVNYYTSWAKVSKQDNTGGSVTQGGNLVGQGTNTNNSQGNGLLPNFLSVSGTTRQNDLDVTFLISIQPGSANNSALGQVYGSAAGNVFNAGGMNNRQAFITFGDKSWGTVKMGKDLGIFASDAILSDITLLGVGGASAGGAGNTSLGRIGFGYIYADWKPQISYSTPNMNGFQATVGITKAFDAVSDSNGTLLTSAGSANASPAYEGKASYSFAANGVDGKVWVSGISQKVGAIVGYANEDSVAYMGDIGANLNMAGFGLTGYYYGGNGIGTTGQFYDAYGINSGTGKIAGRDSDGGYVQLTYVLPTKTKLAASWGVSNLDQASGENYTNLVKKNEMWDAMIIHPLTKHLNLVAEYSNQRSENQGGQENTQNVGSLGAILFF